MVLRAGAFALAVQALPCSAQSAPLSAAAQDSVYLARMNEGYAAAAQGNQVAAFAAFDLASALAPKMPTPRIAAGYALLALKRNDEAIMRFQSALEIDDSQDVVRRQLGYLYADGGRKRDALAAFTWLQTHDRASAQDLLAIGNLNAALGERDLAIKAFHSAESVAAQFGDSVVLRQARSSITVLEANSGGAGDEPGAWVELYLSPFYQTRFDNNVIAYGLARVGVTPGGWLRPSLYASLRATRDRNSVGGLLPVLYADNSVLPAVGVRAQPGGKWFTLYAEAGAAYPLVSVKPRNWKRDLRAGVIGAYSNSLALGSNPRHVTLVSEVYGDATWYDRFDRNVIGYLQWRESLRFIQGRAGAIDVFARGWGAYDSRNTYFNRVVEGGGGIAFHAGTNRRASLYVESLRGYYLRHPAAGEPNRHYDDFRVMFVTGLYHAFPFSSK